MQYNKPFVEQLFQVCRARGFPLSPVNIAGELEAMKETRDYMKILNHLQRTHKRSANKTRRDTVSETCCQQVNPLHVVTVKRSEDDLKSFFVSNFDHIKFLVTEVQYWVAAAYMRLKSIDNIVSIRESFSFLKLPIGVGTSEELDLEIKAMAEQRLQMEEETVNKGITIRFIELTEEYGLDDFEQKILQLMIASETSLELKSIVEQCEIDFWASGFRGASMEIGAILSVLCRDYEEQLLYRRCFSIEHPLVKYELITLACLHLGFLDTDVTLHERISRYCLDDHNVYDTELLCITSERPIIRLDQVILNGQLKKDLVCYTESFLRNNKAGKSLERSFGYGAGLTCLFYGLSGTGKTMLAHGLANHLECQLFSVNIGGLQHEDVSFEEAMKHIFREARLSHGIVFLDECDDLLTDNSHMSRAFLIEVEKAECITILATNKTLEMDPAMDRRISIKIPFGMPDKQQRLAIWQSLLPEGIRYAGNVDLHKLAEQYLFTGGLIKNTLLMASGKAIMLAEAEGADEVVLRISEIHKAARHQARSMFDLGGIGELISPMLRLDELSLRPCDLDRLQTIAEKLPQLQQKKCGLCGLVTSDDIQSCIDAVTGIAAQADLMVRRFSFSQLFSDGKSLKTDNDRIVNPFTQQPVSLLEYVFIPRPGQQEILLLVDECRVFNEFLQDNDKIMEDWLRFKQLLNRFKGVVFLVSQPVNTELVPLEFSCHVSLRFPSEDKQIQLWQQYYPDIEEESIVELVEKYPLYGQEIDRIAGQAEKTAILNGRAKVVPEDLVFLIRRLRNKKTTPLLFG
jgi:DNA polymerase III delta prime subunit